MGELVHLGGITSDLGGSGALLSSLFGFAALGIYALVQAETGKDDDDDQGPGGGLMQPVG
jgi:hypothetical protein